MKIVAVIPARYNSSRFPGKPLAEICGFPMIWWVYNQVKKANQISDVIVATDDSRIAQKCSSLGLNYIITKESHRTSTERVYEVAQNVDADLYIVINGDEPLIDPQVIEAIIPKEPVVSEVFVSNLMTKIKSPVEAVDFTNIKLLLMKMQMRCFSRAALFRIRRHQLITLTINMSVCLNTISWHWSSLRLRLKDTMRELKM